MIDYKYFDTFGTYRQDRLGIVNGEYETFSECFHRMAEAGNSCRVIGERFGIGQAAVRDHLRRMGVTPHDGRKKCVELTDEAVCLYRSGMGFRKLSKHTGIRYDTLRKLIRERGIQIVKTGKPRLDVPGIPELYATGLSSSEVARELGVSRSLVLCRLKEEGIARRPVGRKKWLL